MNTFATQASDHTRNLADQAAGKAKDGIEATRQRIDSGLDSARAGVEEMRERIPAKLGQAAGEVERLARLSLERALNAAHSVKGRVDAAGETTVSYVRTRPLKSVLIAAASGAVLMGALSWWARSRNGNSLR